MGKLLLIEPYDELARIIGLYLEELGYQFDVVTDAGVGSEQLGTKRYDCVLINVDQNNDQWRHQGMHLGERASALHIPVVMIADHKADALTAAAKGRTWVRKPFSLENLETAIDQAVARA